MSKKITFRLVEENSDGFRKLTVPEDVTWGEFLSKVKNVLGSDEMKIKYIDSDEDEVSLDTAEELEEAIRWMSKKEDSEERLSGGSKAASEGARLKDESGPDTSVPRCDGTEGLDKERRVSNNAVHTDNPALLASAGEGHSAGEPAAMASTAPPWFREAFEQLKAELTSKLWAEYDRSPLAHHSAPNQVAHVGVCCDFCGSAIVGVRYKCGSCPDYDLCEACEALAEEVHPLDHAFIKLRRSTRTAGRTSSGHLVPLLIGSPYDELPDECVPLVAGWSQTDDAALTAQIGSGGTCKRSGAGVERRLRKLDKIESRMARNGRLEDELRREERKLQERLDRAAGVTAAAASSHCAGEACPDAAAAATAACCSGDEFAPELKRLSKKLEKVQREIGKMAKQRDKLREKKSGLTRCLGSDCLAEAMAAAEPEIRPLLAKKCSRSAGGRKEGFRATFVGDETVPDGSKLAGGTKFVKRWMLRNDGATGWDQQATLKKLWGNIPSSVSEVALPPLAPGEQGVVSVEFEAPLEEGQYRSSWRPCRAGKKFGNELWCSIKVIPRLAFGEPPMSDHRGTDGSTGRPGSGKVGPADATESSTGAQCIGESSASPGAKGNVVTIVASHDPLGVACASPPDFERRHEEAEGEHRSAVAAAAAAASLETVCHYVHMKMTATSQTATPNNTPLAMSPPKSPEPSLRGVSRCAHAASACSREPGGGSGGSSVVRSLGTEWELRAPSAPKSDHSSCVGESDSDEDGCYDADDFCIIPVPACFNLQVPYADTTAVPAVVGAGADVCQPARHGADGTAAYTDTPEGRSAPDNGAADLGDGGSSAVHLSDDAYQAQVSVCVVPLVEPQSLSARDLSVVPSSVVTGDALTAQAAAVQSDRGADADSNAKVPFVNNPELAGPDADGAAASGAALVLHTPPDTVHSTAMHGAPAAKPDNFDNDDTKEAEAGLSGGSTEDEPDHLTLPTEPRDKRPLGLAEYVFSKVRGAWDLLKLADEDAAPAPPVSNVTYELLSVDHTGGFHNSAVAVPSPHVQEVENIQILTPPAESAIDQLVAMGFANRPLNKELLQKHDGDIESVLRELLEEHDNEWYSRRH